MSTLADAVKSLHVGSAWDPRSFVTPLIREPEHALQRALNQLEPGESWLVPPRLDPANSRLVSPAVKLGVNPGSFTHTTELFGPVLAVVRARNLQHAIELANATGYGLTAGIASLDEREQAQFMGCISAGNVYVNRTITGAIVQRQPFGGFGKSGFGPGAKAGGPNYVAQLCQVAPRRFPAEPFALSEEVASRLAVFEASLSGSDARWLRAAVHDYARAFANHFALAHDPQKILGQDNLFRYLPCPGVVLRVEADAALAHVAASALAALIAGASLRTSVSPRFPLALDGSLCGHPLRMEEVSELTGRHAPRLRLLGERTRAHDALCASDGTHIAAEPVLPLGRFELLHYLREQSVSVEYHRYGQLGLRGLPT
jgi:RHH-type proline utilization regulon transcriptional repressor/proline dehydrogenase/delta 1-pyrroline-5-carboxylate dehydrogenase